MSIDPLDIVTPTSLSTASPESASHPVYPAVDVDPPARAFNLLSKEQLASELEQFRSRADETEVPFGMLVACVRNEISSTARTSFLDELLVKLRLPFSCAGFLEPEGLAILLERMEWDDIEELLEALQAFEKISADDLTLYSYPYPQLPIEFHQYPLASQIKHESLQPFFAMSMPRLKRLVDVALSSTGLVCLAPVFAVIALLIRCSSPGPVFFRQRRSGLGGVPFVIYKFRSMVNQAELQQSELQHLNEQDGPAFKIPCDPRVTRVGQILRRTCLDELPQLFNVLQGNMSLVGPRPLPCHESDSCQWWQRRRLDVTPGITCTWQARGKELVSFDQWMRMDLEYVRNRSVKLDLQILLKTFKSLLA